MAKSTTNRQRDPLRSVAQRRVIEMNITVGRACAPVAKQPPRDMQAFAVHDRVGGVRMPQVMKPRVRHDSGRVARLDPEPPQVIRTQRPIPLAARKHPLPGRRFGEAVQQLPRRLAE